MRYVILTLMMAMTAMAQNAQIGWDTQLDRPVDHPLIIYKGETLDLLPRLVQGTTPVSITNTAIYFRYREPALVSSNLYREVAISTNEAAGTLHMEWTPALDVGSTSYDYEFVVGGQSSRSRPDHNARHHLLPGKHQCPCTLDPLDDRPRPFRRDRP